MFHLAQYGQSGLFLDDRCCLLARLEGANGDTPSAEDSGLRRAMTVTGATISTAQYKTGGSSGYFRGSPNDSLTMPEGLECVLRDDYTLQFWVYFNGTPTLNTVATVLTVGGAGIYANSFAISWRRNAGFDALTFYSSGGGYLITGSKPTAGTWLHVALTRYLRAADGVQQTELWMDGVSVGTTTATGSRTLFAIAEQDGNGQTGFGCYVATSSGNKSEFASCYLDEVQIINGTALYRDGVTFTPPAYEL